MNFYKHHIGDYAAATAHLSFVEDAAYSRLLRIYYRDERPLPVDVKAVQRLAAARSRDEREAIETVLHEFFVVADDGWHSKRADEEIVRANAQADTNRRIAEEREARKRERFVQRDKHEALNESSESREPSQTPDARHHQETKDSAQPAASRFDEFWQAYPHKRGKKPSLAKWKAKRLDDKADAIVKDVQTRIRSDERWLRGVIPDPLTYLSQERWDDELKPTAAKPATPMGAKAAMQSGENPLERIHNRARHDHHIGLIDADERDRRIADATAKHRQGATA